MFSGGVEALKKGFTKGECQLRPKSALSKNMSIPVSAEKDDSLTAVVYAKVTIVVNNRYVNENTSLLYFEKVASPREHSPTPPPKIFIIIVIFSHFPFFSFS